METYLNHSVQPITPVESLKIPEGCETEIRLSESRNEFTLLMKFVNMEACWEWMDSRKYDEFLEEVMYSHIGTVIFVTPEEISGIRRVVEVIPTPRRRCSHKINRYFETF